MENKRIIQEAVREMAGVIGDMNQSVWNYAEVGYEEHKSSEKLMEVLRSEGFSVQTKVADIETAFIGSYGEGKPVIGILAEYDALPGLSQEAGMAEHKPIEGAKYGHGCGHCTLGAGAVGAALAVKAYLDASGKSGTVKLFGCPAEEFGFGKAFMARAGCFEGVDMAFTWHPGPSNAVMAERMVAYYKVQFSFRGQTSHAGQAPEKGRSALDACELMNVGVNYLREHVISTARIHYAYLDCGGEAPNIVQDHASLLYFIRAPKLFQCGELLERVKKIAKGAALMTETEVEIKVLGGLNDVISNPTGNQLLADAWKEAGGPDFDEADYDIARRFWKIVPENVRIKTGQQMASLQGITPEEFDQKPLAKAVFPYTPSMRDELCTGSSDVGDVSYLVPTAQIVACNSVPSTQWHTWQLTAQTGTTIGDKAACAAARVIALAATRIIDDPDIAKKAREELIEETGGIYVSPIPDDVK